MFLKSLHLVGFKSFADKTLVNFHPGVTAIVGPNGCGKSNVLDAVKWVLGEQSAKALRGGSMGDVIFSGSDTRKAVSMAEVSLTFGDCEKQLGTEYNEVTITRRVFKDGVSEYEMNKTPCRLRDIHQLFMDTGVGRSAYSMMEQGKIDQILSSHPEDRRAVFEEAAGITKYKTQRKEALRKLEHTEGNLLRLADILAEVKRQIGSLQRQAGKARRYREMFDELKGLETQLARHQFDGLTAELNSLQVELEAAKAEQDQLSATVEQQDQELHQKRRELDQLEQTLQDIRDRQNQARNKVEQAWQRKALNEKRVVEFTDLQDRSQREVASLEEKIRIQQEQAASLTQSYNQGVAQRDNLQQTLQAKQEELQDLGLKTSELEAEQAEREEEKIQAQHQLARTRQELAALELQQRNFLFRVDNLKAEQASLVSKRQEAETRRAEQAQELAEAQTALQHTRLACETAQANLQTARERVQETEKEHRQSDREYQSLFARRDAVQQLLHKDSKVLMNPSDFADVSPTLLGRLADHVQARPGYETPIALLLGETWQALLAQDAAIAESLVAAWHHKIEKRPLIVATVSSSSETLAKTDDRRNTEAINFIQTDEVTKGLIETLLCDCYIVSDLQTAIAFKQFNPRAIIATDTGDVIDRNGVIYCGKRDEASVTLFTRRAELRELEEQLATQDVWRQLAESSLASTRVAEQEFSGTLHDLQSQRQTVEISVATAQQTQRALQNQVQDWELQEKARGRDLIHLMAQDEQDHKKHAELAEASREVEACEQKAQIALEQLQQQLESLREDEDRLRQVLTEQKIELATHAQQCNIWRQQRDQSQTRVQELQDGLQQRSREISDYEHRILETQEDIKRAETEAQEGGAQVSALLVEHTEKEQLKQEQLRQIEEREQNLRAERRQLTEFQEARSNREIKAAEKRLALDQLRERIRRLYQTELEQIPLLPEDKPHPDWNALELFVSEKRQKLDAMGPVNLEAITEYEELEQRHTFLGQQHEDLVKGKEQLLQAIAEINQTTKTLFAEAFEKVRVNFQDMFTQLFGGGKANLLLQDENDPLECGIDIIAKPPGKQLQSITLMSGGEKTMTAVALLFAIYLVKPSPFCILDEMDAPLDESNINRFIKILQRFVEQSQFIVITHNRRTISMADVLYGVTMEERGVSRIVSIKLNKNSDSPRETKTSAESFDNAGEVEDSAAVPA